MNHPPGDRITLSSLVASFHILFPFKRGWNLQMDRMLGPRCEVCGTRVFPADEREHSELWCD